MFSWFESFIDLYRPIALEQPPTGWFRFFWYYVRQVWTAFAIILFFGFFGGLIELSLFAFLGKLVDLARAAKTPESFFAEHGTMLIWMGFVALILRPIVFAFHIMSVNQAVSANFTNLIRWQTHRYVLRQSLAFFQNDFAGRIANRVMQTGPALRQTMVQLVDAMWFVLIYTTGAMVLFSEADVRLIIPLLIWLVLYIGFIAYFVPRLKKQSTVMSEARSLLMGRIVDSYTNIQTVKLFSHTESEDGYARAAVEDHTRKFHRMLRLNSLYDMAVTTASGFLIVSTCGLALWLWSHNAVTLGAVALTTTLVIRINNMAGWIMFVMTAIFENVGIVQEGMESISQPIKVSDAPDAKALFISKGAIRYEHIRFHYGREGGLIEDLSLTIAPGEKVGLVGRSGAGKSTLFNLLLRFHDLEAGRILIDGQDIAGVTQELAAGPDRRRHAGHLALAPVGLRQYPLWPARNGRGGCHRRRQAGPRPRVHSGARGLQGAQSLSRPCRRARREAVGWPASADRDCARAPEGRADPALGRGDLGARFGGRGGDPGAALQSDAGQDRDRHRPQAVYHRGDGPADRHGSGTHRRGRYA